MELKNVNPDGYNVVIYPIFSFFFKNIEKLSEIKDFKVYFRVEDQ